MIDTIKIYAEVTKDVADIISSKSIVKTSYNKATGEVYYNLF